MGKGVAQVFFFLLADTLVRKARFDRAFHRRVLRLRRWGVGLGSAVTGSGAHLAMVPMVDNASGIHEAFPK